LILHLEQCIGLVIEKNTWRDCGCIFNKYFNITFIRV
jgi:hypothetical protein